MTLSLEPIGTSYFLSSFYSVLMYALHRYLLFLINPCLVVTFHPRVESFPIKKIVTVYNEICHIWDRPVILVSLTIETIAII